MSNSLYVCMCEMGGGESDLEMESAVELFLLNLRTKNRH